MQIIIAPDSFKGSLTSKEFIDITKAEIKIIFPEAAIIEMPLADGGEGTLDVIMEVVGDKYEEVMVKDPLFRDIPSCYGLTENKQAVIEMAKASGLPLIPQECRNAAKTTSYGTGQLIKDAIEKGYDDIIMGLGGSATNDGGMGMLAALGMKFYDQEGTLLEPIGENLGKIAAIDNQDFLQTIKGIHFTVMCDITNPLLGEKGATYTFGPQKGATKEILEMLESGMTNFSSLAEKVMHKSAIHVPGAGAAGGLGWAFCQFFEAELKSGIETILDLYKFDEAVQKADLVISGEGHADGQSVDGKLLSGLGKTCGKYDVPLIAIVGGMSDGAEKLMDLGVSSIITTINDVMNIDYAMEHSYRLLKSASSRALRLIKAGMKMKP